MTWERLYHLQQNLDQKILEGLPFSEEDLLEEKFLALTVEVGELANETRCFKYWSKKGPNSKEVILEEFVDGIHFLLSLGLDYGYRYELNKDKLTTFETLTIGFHKVYESIYSFKNNPFKEHYDHMLTTYLSLGKMLDFTEEDIFTAYLDKNKVNHERQLSGY